jgi:hypothetical protein
VREAAAGRVQAMAEACRALEEELEQVRLPASLPAVYELFKMQTPLPPVMPAWPLFDEPPLQLDCRRAIPLPTCIAYRLVPFLCGLLPRILPKSPLLASQPDKARCGRRGGSLSLCCLVGPSQPMPFPHCIADAPFSPPQDTTPCR